MHEPHDSKVGNILVNTTKGTSLFSEPQGSERDHLMMDKIETFKHIPVIFCSMHEWTQSKVMGFLLEQVVDREAKVTLSGIQTTHTIIFNVFSASMNPPAWSMSHRVKFLCAWNFEKVQENYMPKLQE